MRYRVLAPQEHALQVDAEDAIPGLFGALVEGCPRACPDARIIMGTIQPSICGYSLRNECLYFDGLGHVSPDKDGFSPLLCDEMNRLLAPVFVHVRDDEFGTFPSKGEGSGSANP